MSNMFNEADDIKMVSAQNANEQKSLANSELMRLVKIIGIAVLLIVCLWFAFTLLYSFYNESKQPLETAVAVTPVVSNQGETVTVSTGDIRIPEMEFTVVKVKDNNVLVLDNDGDVWSCKDGINQEACVATTIHCDWMAQLSAAWFTDFAYDRCSEIPQGNREPPQNYVTIPQCLSTQRLYVDMQGGKITGYHCGK